MNHRDHDGAELHGDQRRPQQRVSFHRHRHAPDDPRNLSTKRDHQPVSSKGEFLLDPRQGARGDRLELLALVTREARLPRAGCTSRDGPL